MRVDARDRTGKMHAVDGEFWMGSAAREGIIAHVMRRPAERAHNCTHRASVRGCVRRGVSIIGYDRSRSGVPETVLTGARWALIRGRFHLEAAEDTPDGEQKTRTREGTIRADAPQPATAARARHRAR